MQKLSKITFQNNKDWMNDEDAVRNWITRYRKELKSSRKHKPALEVYNTLSDEKIQQLYDRYNLYDRKHRNTNISAGYLDEAFRLGAINKYLHKRLLKSDRDEAMAEAIKALESVTGKNRKREKLKQKINEYIARTDKDKDILTRTDVGSIADATPKQVERWNKLLSQDDRLQALKGSLLGAGIGTFYGCPITTGVALGSAAYYKSKADKANARNRLNETLPDLALVSNNQE